MTPKGIEQLIRDLDLPPSDFTPPRKAEPEPEPRPSRRTFTDAEVAQLIQRAAEDLRNALADQRAEILEWVDGLLIETTRHYLDEIADVGDKVISLTGDVADFKRKAIEADIVNLQSETALLRADLDALKATVEGLVSAIAELRDDIASVERGGNVVVLNGATGGSGAS